MFVTSVKTIYEAFGFRLSSDMPLPELIQIAEDGAQADIDISIDPFLKHGFEAAAPFQFIFEQDSVTVRIPDVGVFRMIRGARMIISPFAGADEDLMRMYILGTCFGVLLMQRGVYPLHGSAIEIDGNCYAIVGESGAGKSTLASAFMSLGYKLLSDDVIAVTWSAMEKSPRVSPSYPQQKLWQQSLDAFGMNSLGLRPIYGRESKYCIPINERFCSMPLPLAGVFELVKSEHGEAAVEPIKKLNALPLLYQHTYRQYLIAGMKLMKWHFTQSTELVSQLPIYRLHRPPSGFSAPKLVQLILNTIAAEG